MPSRRALGPKAYKRYWDCTRTLIGLIPSNQSFRLGDIVHHRLGSTVLRLLIDSAGNYCEYGTDALDVYLPVLFVLDNLMKQRWHANEVPNEFRFQVDSKIRAKLKVKLVPHHLEWAEPLIFSAEQNYSSSIGDLRTYHPESLLLYPNVHHPTSTRKKPESFLMTYLLDVIHVK